MKPVRDPAYLAFIRSLPCAVCPRTPPRVEAAHVGRRGLGQKCSDREAIPLCSLHHQEQHRIGLKQFAGDYELDIPFLIEQLNEKPRIVVRRASRFFCLYRDECFRLFPTCNGIGESIELAKMLCREYLIETVFTNRVFR